MTAIGERTRPPGASIRPEHASASQRADWVSRGCLLACVLIFAVFFAWPVVTVALRSLSPGPVVTYAPWNFVFTNYINLFEDSALRAVTINTIEIAALSTGLTLVLGFPMAYLMSRLSRRQAGALYLLIMLPFWVSILVRLFAFTQLLSMNGPVNSLLKSTGLGAHQLLFNTFGTTVGMVNYLLPFLVLILYGGMASVDSSLTLAAKVAGASNWQAFRRIFLPAIWNSVITGTLLIFVMGLGFFLTPALLGGSGNATISTYIGQQVRNYEWGSASAIGVLLLVVTLVITGIAIKMSGVTQLVGTAVGGQKGVSRAEQLHRGPLAIGLWIMTVIGLLLLLVPLIIVIPLSFEATQYVSWPPHGFTTYWYRKAVHDPVWTNALWKSVRVGVLTVIFAVTLGFTTARALLRSRPGILRTSATILLYAPLVVPVILLAIGTFDVQSHLGLLGRDVGLAAVHAVLALPFTVTVFTTALASFDRQLEEAAWSLGASKSRTLRRVVIPIIFPSFLGAALLAFTSSWDEAVVAIFQTTVTGGLSLPVAFFSQVHSGVDPTIAAIGTMLIGTVVLLPLLYLLLAWAWRHRRALSNNRGRS